MTSLSPSVHSNGWRLFVTMDVLVRIAERLKPWQMIFCLLLFETCLNLVIIQRVPYTEIDWRAYMQEVEGVLVNGSFNYYDLKGDTGPLVYPGGFVWLYSMLYYATDKGVDILRAQYIFAGLYMVFIAIVYTIYVKSKLVPLWALPLLSLSKRIHSIFVLRLFNDCISMTFLYGAILLFLEDQWTTGCLLYTVATSIKMNVLLFAPALAFLLSIRFGFFGALPRIALCGLFQVLVAVPFLRENPIAYLHRSFEFGRQFFQIWSVNLKFLPENVFLSKQLAIGLLVCHLMLLLVLLLTKWWRGRNLFHAFVKHGQPSRIFIASVLFGCNFIGIAFAKSLHFQFYVWYYHSIPALLWLCPYPTVLRLALWAGIEVIWNIFPSNFYSSLTLTVLHAIIVIGLLLSRKWPIPYENRKPETAKKQKIK